MMLLRLSVRNARRSLRDYSIYFLTVITAVTVFFVFNTFDSQPVWRVAQAQTGELFVMARSIMTILSVLVVALLAFLIVYANRFMVRSRAREFGTYLTLGMRPRSVSRLLALETSVVGLIALLVGLPLGLAAAQGVSAIAGRILQSPDTGDFAFVFPTVAIGRTVIAFALVFLLAGVWNIRTLRNASLVSLMHPPVRSSPRWAATALRAALLVVTGLLTFGVGCVLVLRADLTSPDRWLLVGLLAGLLGTFVFLAGLGDVTIRLLRRRAWYWRGLHAFLVRQVGSRLAASSVVVGIVAVLLTISATGLATGLGYARTLDQQQSEAAPWDAAFYGFSGVADVEQTYADAGVDLETDVDWWGSYETRASGVPVSALDADPTGLSQETADQLGSELNLELLSVTDYNRLAVERGATPLDLGSDEFAVVSGQPQVVKALAGVVPGTPLTIGAALLTAAPNPVIRLNLDNVQSIGSLLRLVVPDAVAATATPLNTVVVADLRDDVDAAAASRLTEVPDAANDQILVTREIAQLRAFSISSLMAYVGLYIGALFLVAGATVLSIQQLMEGADTRRRYRMIRRLGARPGLLAATLFAQVGVQFLVPLIVATVSSIVLLRPISNTLSDVGGADMAANVASSAGILFVLYLAYFGVAYAAARTAVRTDRRR